MISYITGAILPIVALCMTSMIVDVSGVDQKKEIDNQEVKDDPVEEVLEDEKNEEKNQVVF
jgi:hypothetical protein